MLLAFLLAATPPAAGPGGADADEYRLVNPRAIELFEADPTLMGWALRRFDSNGDAHLSILEADRAAREFKRIADGNDDGRVTPAEYGSARAFVVARWGGQTASGSY